MPNWNSNQLVISNLLPNQKEELQNQLELESFLSHYIPRPVELDDDNYCVQDEDLKALNKLKFGSTDGYHWCLKNWDTKWEIGDVNLSESVRDDEVIAFFNTAWSPCVAGIQKISQLFPNATFILTYEEGGCDFAGSVKFINGEMATAGDVQPSQILNDFIKSKHPELEEDSEEFEELQSDLYGEMIDELTTQLFEKVKEMEVSQECWEEDRENSVDLDEVDFSKLIQGVVAS